MSLALAMLRLLLLLLLILIALLFVKYQSYKLQTCNVSYSATLLSAVAEVMREETRTTQKKVSSAQNIALLSRL